MKRKIDKKLKWACIVVALCISGILSVAFPVDHTNPQVTSEIVAPKEVMIILRRACYDCHSNETKWPWYSYVAPASWLIADDVRVGREHMNFSEWGTYTAKQQKHRIKKSIKLIDLGEMPLWFYVPLHMDSDVLSKDLEILTAWSDSLQ